MRAIVRTFHQAARIAARQKVQRVILGSTVVDSSKTPDQSIDNMSFGWLGGKIDDPGEKIEKEVKSVASEANMNKDIYTALSNSIAEHLKEDDPRFRLQIGVARADIADNPLVVLENWNLIKDALLSGAKLQSLFFSERESLKGLPYACPEASYYHVTYQVLRRWSSVTTSQGIVAVFKRPTVEEISKLQTKHNILPVTLVCDGNLEPGYLGTILRTAATFNARRVLLMSGGVSHWNSLVVRAAGGAHFNLPIMSDLSWGTLNNMLGNPCSVVAMASVDAIENENLYSQFYFNVEYWRRIVDGNQTQGDIVPLTLLVGNPSQAWSESALRFLIKRKATLLTIPQNVGQYNSVYHSQLSPSIISSILLAEIQRQYFFYAKQK